MKGWLDWLFRGSRGRRPLMQALQASEAKLSRILDNALVAISSFRVYANGDWEYDYWSAGCERLFGYDQSAYQDKTFWLSQVYPEDREQRLLPLFNDFYAEREVTAEYRFWHGDGTLRWFASAYTSKQVAEDCWVVTAINQEITERKQDALTLRKQIQQEYLLNDITQDICHSLDLEAVLTRTVERSRAVLESDRVIVLRLVGHGEGQVVAESVASGIPSILSTTIYDPCLDNHYAEAYRQGRVGILHDREQADLPPCYVDLLRRFQVRANLVVPIFQGEMAPTEADLAAKAGEGLSQDDQDPLWGLLMAHECRQPRQWQPAEMALFKRIAAKANVAIQQSNLHGQVLQQLHQRERIQQVLQQSEARFRTLSAAAPIGISHMDSGGRCAYSNARWQEISGLSAEESLGWGWRRVVHSEDRAGLLRAWKQYQAEVGSQREWGQSSHRLPEFRLLTPQGDLRWVAVAMATLRTASGEIDGYVCTIEDISAQKEANRTIHEQATLLDIASDAIFVRDLNHRIQYWNRGAERLYGWSAAEALGQPCQNLLRGDLPYLDSIMQTLMAQGEWQGEIQEITKAGEPIVVAARWTLVRDEAQQPKSILSVETDITEKKALQAQFFQAQRLESLGQLASGIAHDLNNILTPILTMAQLLQDSNSLGSDAQEPLRLIADSAKRGTHMVQQILAITRHGNDQKAIVPVVPLLQDLATVLRSSLPRAITIDLALPPAAALAPVCADPTYLHQVMMNLCINARDAMPNGGTLTLTAEPIRLDATTVAINIAAQVGDYVRLTVADTGVGIDPAVQDRIFDPFFTTKGLGRGTGLGLATVMAIVKGSGGFVQVHSDLGRGTQVQVYLPACPDADPSPLVVDPQAHSPASPGQGELILVVDDDLMVQHTTQALLERHHYRTLVANNGQEALQCYIQHQAAIQIVILDMMMPSLDGPALIQHLRRLNPAVKTLAISGLPAYRDTALAAGANRFLPKPYDLVDLLEAVATLVHPPHHWRR